MKIDFVSSDFRTQLPVVILIQAPEQPKVFLSPGGEIAVSRFQDGYRSEFHVMEPREYELKIMTRTESWSKKIHFEEQKFLTFSREFGVFSLIFIILMTGVVVWTKKLMRS